jgi:hypothetical protein
MLFLNLIQSAGDSFQNSSNIILGDDSVGHSSLRELKRIGKPSLGLMARLGLPVGGWVRKLRAVEDQSVPIPEERMSKLGGVICNLVRWPQRDQHECPLSGRITRELGKNFCIPTGDPN